jgi:succinyl-CoA synthetase beta subunit
VKVYEYQAKSLLAEYGIPVPRGETVDGVREAERAAVKLGGTVMVKAQVLVGGRGKAGGVKMARSPREAADAASRILGMKIKGIEVRKVLVAEAVDIVKEYYLGLAVDRTAKAVQCIASASGGMEIEEVAAVSPDRIVRFALDPERGPVRERDFPALGGAFASPPLAEQAWGFVLAMSRLLADKDCSLVEINPCAQTPDGRLVAADAKVVFDDNALYRHPELESLRSPEEYGAREMEARSKGLSFVGLDGNIGCIVNGAGLSMATMDLIKHFGGSPANFLDVGGSSNPHKVLDALDIVLRDPGIRAILINIFGGITRCDEVAIGILAALKDVQTDLPMVVRLVGTNEVEGRRLLDEAKLPNMITASTLAEAARKSVEAAQGA